MIMTKAEITDAIYKWLTSDEKMKIVSRKDNTGGWTLLFIKLPCTKKGYEDVTMVISGQITDMDDWCSTRNFSRTGFWLPDREVFLEDRVHTYNFCEENHHFISEEKLIQEVKKLSKKGIYDYYNNKYPTYESLGISLDSSDTVKCLQAKIMDLDWLHGTMPVSDWYYFERDANIDWGLCDITTEMCIRYLDGEQDIFYDLFVRPFLDENSEEMKTKINDIKISMASAYHYDELRRNYKPSARALATKKIVDAVNAFLTENADKNIQNFKVTGVFSDTSVGTVTENAGHLDNYDSVYDDINAYGKKLMENGNCIKEDIPADHVIKITYGRKVIYSKDE